MSRIKRNINYSVILIIIESCLVASQPSSVVISTQQQTKDHYSQDFVQTHNKCEPISIPYVFSSFLFFFSPQNKLSEAF